jgi:hypothetical protein
MPLRASSAELPADSHELVEGSEGGDRLSLSHDVVPRSRCSTHLGLSRFAVVARGTVSRMRVAGLELAAPTVAELGRLLQEVNAVHSAIGLGFALGSGRSEFPLGPVEYEEILTALERDCPAELIELRLVLQGK